MKSPALQVEARGMLSAYTRKSLARGAGLFLVDLLAYAACFAGVLSAESRWLRAALGLATGFCAVLLYILGHDAAHHSLTARAGLNKVLGRIAFLPTWHSFTLWDQVHNKKHHAYTNLKTEDCGYVPFSPEEFAALSPLRRLAERFYRSAPGQGCYYFVEVWWKRLFLPLRSEGGRRTLACVLDSALVLAFMAGQGALVFAFTRRGGGGLVSGVGLLESFCWAIVLPQMLSNWLLGFAIWQQHNHPRALWFAELREWRERGAALHTTVHVRYPWVFSVLVNDVMEHTAHHVNMQVPTYNLRRAQSALLEAFPRDVISEPWSVRGYLDTLRRCKLYDYERHQWLDFDGRPTAEDVAVASRQAA